MQRAMERLEAASASRPGQFDRLRGYLTGAEPTVAYRQVAADLGLSEGAVKTASIGCAVNTVRSSARR